MVSPHGGAGGSHFATAARILFDSAKKVGAVEPLGETSKRYAQQLKRIQSQSQKKGGSLGSVSYKVAEFLATQRTPKPNIIRNSTSIAKRVPLIDIPRQPPKKKDVSIAVKPHTENVPPLDFITNEGKTPGVQPARPKETVANTKTSHSESLISNRVVPTLDFVTELRKTKVSSPDASAMPLVVMKMEAADTEKQEEIRDVATIVKPSKATIVEEKPLFETTVVSAQKPSFLAEHDLATLFEKVVHVPEKIVKPKITVPISAKEPSAKVPHVEPVKSGAMSVDAWELQREREIEQLRKSQETAEKERLAMKREEEHKTLGDEWVQHRTTVTKKTVGQTDLTACMIEKMYFSNQWEACFKSFGQLVSISGASSSALKQAVRIMESRLRYIPLEQREIVRSALLKELKQRRLHDEVVKFELRHCVGEAFLQLYHSAPSSVKDTLDFYTVAKAISLLVSAGSWQEAVELVGNSQKRFNDKTGLHELRLLFSASFLDKDAAKSVKEFVSGTLTAFERFGKVHKLQLAKMEKGAHRRQMVLQLIASNHVDEAIYAELLRITPTENIKDVLDEIRKRGLNPEDPAIIAAVCWKTFDPENPQVLFREIEKQEKKTGIRPAHLLAAVAMARASKTRETLRSTVSIVKKAPIFKARFTLRKLLPLLHENNMQKEIVELADFYKDHVPVATALPQAVAFVNDALQAEGRPPLSEQTVSKLQLGDKTSGSGVGSTKATAPTEATGALTAGSEISSEAMLQCAKDRNWMKALMLINFSFPALAKTADADTLTLFYNCALSASVEKVEVVQSIYSSMKQRGVQVNATTNNAVLSSLMRCGRSQEAIEFYSQTEISARDSNTHSVMLSLYGKIGMWEEALELIKCARGGSKKLPPMTYTLGINAVHSHSWSATLALFQALRKEHGDVAIKQAVVDKVVRCLSQNKRTAEIQKLELELAKKKKKQ
ncbi:hypothetical protein TCDM_08588 [Trypanosoma cruzi Dm28c]|uniref:Pentacotripeptide-repeat region of PRORP domain-containing protein n=1 Tax=Trypanosoma cruzi Dm28c TaxID=1416333 RepID=V5BBZ0_TRYCR|nr:hypothetical protein TCDM_08588 [Trypanosoma cruzi Dm28c]PBJ74270.1 hypothetical protein BCY84_12872 [Trypanosoma cruzi cruzi]